MILSLPAECSGVARTKEATDSQRRWHVVVRAPGRTDRNPAPGFRALGMPTSPLGCCAGMTQDLNNIPG